MTGSLLPSIWLGAFDCAEQWNRARETQQVPTARRLGGAIDDRVLWSRHPMTLDAWCAGCQAVQPIQVDWHFGSVGTDGSVHPAWSETAVCKGCGLNSRMRALLDRVQHLALAEQTQVFVAESITASYRQLERRFPRLLGSEFLGADHEPGKSYWNERYQQEIRHEDLTRLSFEDGRFDLVITQDIFEHIPDFVRAFAECRRILRSGGHLVFTVPFRPGLAATEVRARFDANGVLEHLLPPEYHGDPIGDGGVLCFQRFGWDMLDRLREVGFAKAQAHLYWGPWQGHFGFPFFVFQASCAP
ncbi:class I SAM-dependent methyltransferase [Pseudomonas sp. PDNC002]|uniref:class I SAM-dependent methyltransferase n=1 Tax=Pseudomonas sp. PDNC002 TaxID=2811422 RepID=UPI001965214B|nr:class I SAM-dependent methyltransferase [Pseudomonas sp. PDNC002]QRY80463.1 class I SAM-dependent methyltransferase [Pseudomonas sp. PDNC002]